MADIPSAASLEPARRGSSRLDAGTASRGLYLAVATLVGSMLAISLFFAGAGAYWGPVNDVLVVATVLLLLPAMAVLPALARPEVGRWFGLVSMASGIGVGVIAAGQLALVAGLVTLETSFVTGGLGVLPVIVWIGTTAVPSFRLQWLGRTTALWAMAFVVLVAVTVVVVATLSSDVPVLTGTLGVPLAIALVGWMLSLGRGLARAGRRG